LPVLFAASPAGRALGPAAADDAAAAGDAADDDLNWYCGTCSKRVGVDI
jgi:hypothetical protein